MLPTSIVEILHSKTAQVNVFVGGWVRTRRSAKDVVFLELNDGSCLKNIQCVVDINTQPYEALDGVNTGACVSVQGALVASPGKGQSWEIQVTKIWVHGFADPEVFPLQKKRHSDKFLRKIAHLRVRTNKYGAIFRVRSEAALAIHNYFHDIGFFYVHTPILTASDCEGSGEVFQVVTATQNIKEKTHTLFDRECYLTVSGQLEAECLAMGLGKVYTFGPTFRAENSNTSRHAAEFWMVEPECAFATLYDIMDLAEKLICFVIKRVFDNCIDELTLFDTYVSPGLKDRLQKMISKPFVRCSYRDAIEILQLSGKSFEVPVFFGSDLQAEHEKYLTEEHFVHPVIVYDYPKEIKAFYMRQNDDGKTVAAMDLLVPHIGELIGGSQREERLEHLVQRLEEIGRSTDNYWWYLELRHFGTVPHAGFGLGFERLLMLLTGVSNIRDVLPFPRTPGTLEI